MRLTTDLFAYCAERIPSWNTISISGYHIREAGSTAVQELAFTLANGIAYCDAAVAAGLSPDDFGERLSFFFNAHNHFFQEVAKFRAARRLWARIMSERFGATNPKALALRFHAQTGGSTLTAQQPQNNVVRVAIQALSAVCGGAQSLHTNSFDEALALPSEHAARLALRTQQILASEAGGTRHRRSARRLVLHRGAHRRARAARLGADRAHRRARRRRRGGRAGLRPGRDRAGGVPLPAGGRGGRARHRRRQPLPRGRGGADRAAPPRPRGRAPPARADCAVRAERNADGGAGRARARARRGARDENMLPPLREALRARCTIGEICNELRDEWGMYDHAARARMSEALEYHRATNVAAGGTDEDEARTLETKPSVFKDYGDAERVPLETSIAGPVLQDGAGVVRSQDDGATTAAARSTGALTRARGRCFPVEAYVAAADGALLVRRADAGARAHRRRRSRAAASVACSTRPSCSPASTRARAGSTWSAATATCGGTRARCSRTCSRSQPPTASAASLHALRRRRASTTSLGIDGEHEYALALLGLGAAA